MHDVDDKLVGSIHIAAMTGRAEQIKLILGLDALLVNAKDKAKMTPLAYACKGGHTEAAKALLEFQAVREVRGKETKIAAKINMGVGLDRSPPLAMAAALGHYELAEYLIGRKARINGKDKFKRSPLTMACKNGHAKLASLLLQHGADWNQEDSSSNTPLHFAAAYGWP